MEEREPVWSKRELGWTPYTYEGEAEEIARAKVINLSAAKFETRVHTYANLEETVITYTTDPN